ncbi:MAG: peptidoglycan DD-metalloendopeptidase family protein [Firmicutes bacterium]|nr:peptidoglycan DD-metalloendopeptidase family protein [Bacillota bacterium]
MTKKHINQEAVRAFFDTHKKEIVRTAAGMLVACLVSVGAAALMQPKAYVVSYQGEIIGYVQDTASVDEALDAMKASVMEATGLQSVEIEREGLIVEQFEEKTNEITFASVEELTAQFVEKKAYSCEAYSIVVDGTPVLAMATQEEAETILNKVLEHYSAGNSKILSVDYKEDVEIVATDARDIQIGKDIESGVTYILTGTEDPRTYIVEKGDTLWDIAKANGMSSAELVAANPGFNPNRLKIGQALNLVAMKPFMTVTITEEVTQTEVIPYTTKYTENSNMYRGQTELITAGKNGSKEVVSKVISENGVIVSEEVLSETVISEPVMATAYKGTKALVYTAKGRSVTLQNPMAVIQVSDKFGASRGSRRHVGIDLRNPKGTTIMAAADGLVTFAGYKNSFGKLIIIDHGNGMTTKYAHCDAITVNVGDVVSQGQKIGTVGRTGNATGNILHYEVLINGKNQNPINYLDY